MEKSTSHSNPSRSDRELSDQILETANLSLARADFLREILTHFIEFFDYDAVELWLDEGGIQTRCEAARQPNQSFRVMMAPRVNDKASSSVEKFCRDLLSTETEPGQGLYSRNDVFWIADLPQDETEVWGNSYRSLALSLLKVGKKRVGLLLLKSGQPAYFSGKDLAPCGRVAKNLAMALINQRAQSALHERIKELTCLYQISRMTARRGIPLREALQSIADSLPPAWQYPGIASSRILFDDFEYETARSSESVSRQTSEIIVSGKLRGLVEVMYGEFRPELYEGPFLREERHLLDTVARQAALFIEQREAAEQKDLLEEQLRHADRLATVGKLAAGVAHELNEPLGSILGFAQLARKSAALPVQAAQDLDKIISASLHAREVIRKLMLFARQMPARKSRVDLNRVVKEGLYLLEPRCARQGVQVVLSLSPELPEVDADPTQMTQVFTNLVVNALQAMPGGGRLSLQTLGANGSVSLIVEDTGQGMSKEVQKQIFIPFFTTKDVDQGTGLGLAVVHGIVAAHHGSIDVKSQVGRGTRIEVHLPAGPIKEGDVLR
jgi:signal transduction histidine kinase